LKLLRFSPAQRSYPQPYPISRHDAGEPVRLIEFGALRGIAFFVATLFSGAIWLTGLWHVGKWAWALLLALAVGGCVDGAKLDDAKCQGYGAALGSPAYVQCRAQLDAARTQAQATIAAAPINTQPSYRPPTPVCVNGIC
jgi:hypothetical protein